MFRRGVIFSRSFTIALNLAIVTHYFMENTFTSHNFFPAMVALKCWHTSIIARLC